MVHNIPATNLTGPLTLSGDGIRSLRLRPSLDWDTIRANSGVPTSARVGAFKGFSMPLYDDSPENYEELFVNHTVPRRWNEESDIILHLPCAIVDGTDDGKFFKFQFSWNHTPCSNGVIPSTFIDVPVEQEIGAVVEQYQKYLLSFTLNYDENVPAIAAGDNLGGRIRRIAATGGVEASGEIIVYDPTLEYRRDKLGASL